MFVVSEDILDWIGTLSLNDSILINPYKTNFALYTGEFGPVWRNLLDTNTANWCVRLKVALARSIRATLTSFCHLFIAKFICRCFYSIIVPAQVKLLIWSKTFIWDVIFCHLWQAYSYSFYILNTQTIAKWKKRVIWEICTLTGQTVVVWCGSRSGELSLEIMGLGIFICLKNEVPLVVKWK